MKKMLIAMLVLIPLFLFGETIKISGIKGQVMVKATATSEWTIAQIGMKLDDNAILKTSEKSSVLIVTSTGNAITIWDSKTLAVKDIPAYVVRESKLIKLKNKLSKANGTSIGQATAVAGVRGADIDNQQKKALAQDLYWEE